MIIILDLNEIKVFKSNYFEYLFFILKFIFKEFYEKSISDFKIIITNFLNFIKYLLKIYIFLLYFKKYF